MLDATDQLLCAVGPFPFTKPAYVPPPTEKPKDGDDGGDGTGGSGGWPGFGGG
ncbi:MAG: hypothetical protein WHS87_01335 [Anaerolineales bacterium]